MNNRKTLIILVSIFSFLMLVGGTSYAYFIYNKDIGEVSVETGNISLNFSNSNNLSLTNLVPISDNLGKENGSYIDFNVTGSVDTERIYYEVYMVPKSNSTMTSEDINNYVKTYLTDQNDVKISNVKLYKNLRDSTKESGKILYQAIIEPNTNGTSKTENKDFRLRVWLSDEYSDLSGKTFNFNIYLYAINVDENFELPLDGAGTVRKAINAKINAETNACNPIWVDNMDTANDESDDITYFSGTNDCVDMNYVWYSGKLWRITAIYPDGSMKLVTQNNITTIAFSGSNSDVNFYTDANTTSYMYQWLNEDFYDTLYNAEEFIDNTKQWNATMTSSISARPDETNVVSASVGLLNSYEYYNSYRCIGDDTCVGSSSTWGYLNNRYYWRLLNPYSSSSMWRVYSSGSFDGSINPYGVRPSIYLKFGVEFEGSGSVNIPYKIVGDKDVGKTNDLINTRLSGEYVKLVNNDSNQTFRIIGIEDNKTKIIAMDYADNKGTRLFATSTGSANTLWGSGTTTDADTWYDYLNNTYVPNLKNTYGELFDSSTYYLGTSGYNYKLSVCANTTSGNTKVCDKTSQVGTFNIGLPRYGEMFATQQRLANSNLISMWLMNRYSTSKMWFVDDNGMGSTYNSYPTSAYGARPTLHLKSSVKIISGTGTESDPYVVGL